MKNLPIYGAARRLAVFSVFRSGQKHAASKKTHGPNDRALHFSLRLREWQNQPARRTAYLT